MSYDTKVNCKNCIHSDAYGMLCIDGGCKGCRQYSNFEKQSSSPKLNIKFDNVLNQNKDRKDIAEAPALQYLHDPDANPVYSVTHNLIAKVVTAENKAIVAEIKEWARIKGNTTVIEMDEDRLMKIIELGSRELERLEKERGTNIF